MLRSQPGNLGNEALWAFCSDSIPDRNDPAPAHPLRRPRARCRRAGEL